MRAAPRARARDHAGRHLGQVGMRVRRGDFVECQPVSGIQIVHALGERLHVQPGAVEELVFTGHSGNSAANNSSRHRKLGTMKSAPTPARRCRFHSSTVRHSGSARGHAHRDAAHLLDILDFDVAVAEAQEFRACEFGRGDQALDQDLLREALVVVQRAVDPAFEVARDIEQPGLFAHVRLVGAAGQIQAQAAFPQRFDRARARRAPDISRAKPLRRRSSSRRLRMRACRRSRYIFLYSSGSRGCAAALRNLHRRRRSSGTWSACR